MEEKKWGHLALAAVGLLFLMLVTNRWMSWTEGLEFLYLSDVRDYQRIGETAPAFPVEPMAFHKAQRFILPYLLGVAAKAASVPVEKLFTVALFAVHGALFWIFWSLLSGIGVPMRRVFLAFALVLCQPYVTRYYWIAQGMFLDSTFALGALVYFWGLLRGRALAVIGGLVLAVTARQTGVLLLPALAYLVWGGPWRDRRRVSLPLGALVSVLVVAIYSVTGLVAKDFAFPNGNLAIATELFRWLAGENFTWQKFAEHLLRCVLPLMAICFLLLLENVRRWPLETWMLALTGLLIAAQPFFAGPETTGQNAGRLTSMAMLPLALGWGLASGWQPSARGVWALTALLFIGSFHHMYSVIGPGSAAQVAALQLAVAVGLAGATWWLKR